MNTITHLKDSSKSSFYSLGHYQITIPNSRQYVFKSEYNENYASVDDESMLSCVTITITNTNTKQKSTKRCYQDIDTLLDDLEIDYNNSKKKFNWV